MSIFTSLFGSRNQRLVKAYDKRVRQTNALEEGLKSESDERLADRTNALKQRLADGETLDKLLPEAFALVRESASRTLGMRHFDVQLIGGMALHEGKIAEMKTGEGKTLMATLAAYLNALSGKGVHIVTVNEYLAQRDADWMGPVYRFLGLTVGVIQSGQNVEEKRAAYACDITYGTNNEFGFDYLRDNLAFRLEDRVQRATSFAIVDEVDSILIDEARTPLIISGPSEERSDLYVQINKLVPGLEVHDEPAGDINENIPAAKVNFIDADGNDRGPLPLGEALALADDAGCDLVPENKDKVPTARAVKRGDFTVDEKTKQAHLTEQGHETVEQLLTKAGLLQPGESLYDAGNIRLMHHLTAALRAHGLYKKDVDYIVKDGEVVIVDEFTGRTMAGRRWSDGLHQAIEAKEGVRVKEENQTVASITFQNYFRLYDKLAGMTGTADTEAFEFQQIYGLEVVVIPTHKPMIRKDNPDLVYLTQKDKFDAIIEDIKDCNERGQPVLVGTTSIETSEYLSNLLKKRKIPHQVLNAKYHEQEAEIIVQAGRPGTVTIATNMAGRGTDIVLGGNLEAELQKLAGDEAAEADQRTDWEGRHKTVLEQGGLHIIGTERHESRRIDNQLRGRSGRQGDPGSSRFYLSMEDNLMRIFGDPARTKALLSRVGMKEGEVIESKLLSRQIERAQRKVEAHNFDIRKQLLEYDDVANDQRKVVYEQRKELMQAGDVADAVAGIREEVIDTLINEYIPPGSVAEQWEVPELGQALARDFDLELDLEKALDEDEDMNEAGLRQLIHAKADEAYESKVESIGGDVMRQFEKVIMLQQLDSHWKEHLAAMDYLRQGIHLRGYAQKNPKQEYKREAFEMFSDMLDQIKHDTISILAKVRVRSAEEVEAVEEERAAAGAANMRFQHAQASAIPESAPAVAAAGGGAGAVPPARPAMPAQAPETPFVRSQPKIGRNEPCPCGSGKKYKQCHGRLS